MNILIKETVNHLVDLRFFLCTYNKKFDTNLPLNKINISKFDKNILTILFLGGIFQNVYNSYLFFVINGGSNETKRTCILA